ncbi:hypothetical protein A2U01_0060556, partial [Trifolium medium]|nr:hypothetical protein [Trifolium medium]
AEKEKRREGRRAVLLLLLSFAEIKEEMK